MTEWEKMLAGIPCDDREQQLEQRRIIAKKLFWEYNKTTEEDTSKRKEIMRKLFRGVGENVFIEPDFICEFGSVVILQSGTTCL